MIAVKHVIFFLLCAFITECAFSQRSTTTKSRTSRSKGEIVCPVFEGNKFPYQGFGFKLGDPFALTYKFYPNRKFSFAIDFGKASSSLYNHYFRDKFYQYTVTDTLSPGATMLYSTHRVKTDFMGDVKILYQIDAKEISPGLQLYLGVGWEWKRTALRYDYLYRTGNGSENRLGNFERNRFTMGPQFVIGIEYAYFQIPISAFMELEYFTDIQTDPGWRRFEGGIGLRYIF
jgi:hypothetical protein